MFYQNYPNPFNPSTSIKFGLPEASDVSLKVYDIIGREVATLANDQLMAGYYSYNFNARNLSSDVYIYRIAANSSSDLKKGFPPKSWRTSTQVKKLVILR